MKIDYFYIRKYKTYSFTTIINPSKFISLLFLSTIVSFDIWRILTASGLELTNGKDIYSFLNGARLDGQSRDYEFLFMNLR